MIRPFRHAAIALGAATLLLAGGCSAPAPRPVMVEQSAEIPYGYNDLDLGDGRFEVTYETPVLRTSTGTLSREQDVEAQKQRAYDLALWRAAQIAVDRGYEHFVVVTSSSDADVEVPDDRYDPAYAGFGYGYGHRHYPFGYDPYYYGYDRFSPFAYAPPPRYKRDAQMRVTVTMTVREATAQEEGAMDAVATVARLSSRYANSTFPGR